ncbi:MULTISPECIES: hypothetical protein [unclassified Nocardia]|uniref:hypothetical protein n=1 Tax=unclassified Nocardia TaxID=2637762 RepID=UPI001CE437B6|nr:MULTISPECIES: hypothetical protein [unclassified Nocardia]
MSEVVAHTDAIRAYGGASAAMAAGVATAGAFDQTATMAAAVPVFGLIGQEFLASFAYAQANHVSSVLELAHVYAGTAKAALEGAGAYDGSEIAQSGEFDSISTRIV